MAITSKERFLSRVADRIDDSANQTAFLFVHGYNVDFADAARRTAQLAYDLEFDGAPVFYSWPSQGNLAGYLVDEQNVEWAQANLKAFLDEFFAGSGAKRIYLIAHSMGNRALTRALIALLAEKPQYRERLSEVILAAPDIDADVFKRDIAPAILTSGRPLTLYASSQDQALIASKKAHGYPRAGDSGQGLVLVSGMETIDATGVDLSLLGHSYFSGHRVLTDILEMINQEHRASQRSTLRSVQTEAGRYWAFRN